MKQEKLKANEVKLQPVSNEEVQQILNGDSKGMAYGCGSGSGCGCGEGSGSGSGDERKYQKVSGSKVMNLEQEISYGDYSFIGKCTITVNAYADRYYKNEQWDYHVTRVDFSFAVKGKENYTGIDQDGNRIVYETSGNSKNFPFDGSKTYESCELECKTVRPESENVRITLNAGYNMEVREGFNDNNTLEITPSPLNCGISEI